MEYFIYSMLFILGVGFVALMLVSMFGHRDEVGCAEVKSVRAPEVWREAA